MPSACPASALQRLYTACESIRVSPEEITSFEHELNSLEDYEMDEIYHKDYYSQFFFVKNMLFPAFAARSLLLGMFAVEHASEADGIALAKFLLTQLLPTNAAAETSKTLVVETPGSWRYLKQEAAIMGSDNIFLDSMY